MLAGIVIRSFDAIPGVISRKGLEKYTGKIPEQFTIIS